MTDAPHPAEVAPQAAETSTILVLCPTHRDHRELAALAPDTRFLFHDYASIALEEMVAPDPPSVAPFGCPLAEIDKIIASVEGVDLVGIVSTDDYPGVTLAAAVAQRLGLPGPGPAAVLLCQHKFEARNLQQRHAPDAVPDFALIDTAPDADAASPLGYPVFVKPVKSFFSVGSRRIASSDELAHERRRWARADVFFEPFELLLQHYTGVDIGTRRLIAETPLDGAQCTLEGYVWAGRFHLVGIVDSIFFPGTLAFERFEYPSRLPEALQRRMAEIAEAIMCGIGFDGGMFNIEFAADEASGRVSVIEINPRMASQFADLYEKVDGTNSYAHLLALSAGAEPSFSRGNGAYRMAASCVLRCFEDRYVRSLPPPEEVEILARRHPGTRIEVLATAGRKLSQDMQDEDSYRYGIVSIGGKDRGDILAQLEDVKRNLTFAFDPV